MKWMYFFPPGRRRRLHQKPYSQWNTRYNCVNGNDWLDINFVFFLGFWIELVLTFFFFLPPKQQTNTNRMYLIIIIDQSLFIISHSPFEKKKQPPSSPSYIQWKGKFDYFHPYWWFELCVCFNQTILFFVRISYFHNDGHP